MPEARFDGVQWRMTPGGFAATLKGEAALDFGPARDIAFSTRGELVSTGGRLTYTTNDCIPLTVRKLDLGENSVEAVTGRACPTSDPLVVVQNGLWRARTRLADVAASVPVFEAGLSAAEGELTVDGGPKGVSMRVGVAKAQVADTADPVRFLPLQAKGEAQLADDVWTAAFDLSRLDHAVGRVDVRHDVRAEAGGAVISAPSLTFTEHGLQPDDLSPLVADYVKSPVEGSAGFEGRFDWTAESATSSGVLTVPDLDFTSPAGKVQGLKGRVEFTSLTPLITAPNQTLTADRVQTVTPLTDLQLSFGLDEKALTIGGGQIQAAGGRISVEPLSLPLTPGEGWGGVVVVEGVQLNELLKSANLQDKAEFDAVVMSGGSETPRDLPVPGRELSGVYFAMDFLRQQNKAVAGDRLTNQTLAKGKHVVVIGGGDTGSDCVGTSNRHGAASVTQFELMPQPPESENKAMTWPYWPLKMRTSSSHEEGCERDWSVTTKLLKGSNGKVEKLVGARVEWFKDEATGQMKMREVEGSEFEIKADLVLLAMGFVSPVQNVLDAFGVDRDGRGNVRANTDDYRYHSGFLPGNKPYSGKHSGK